jgi:hypothetical protein
MTSRREFLQIGVTASALSLAGRAAWAAPGREDSAASSVALYKVLYDTRIPASAAFARRAESRGVPTYAMTGDMTRFWYDDLYHRWLAEPAAIAGLTAHGPMFCLERLAWDQGMRVVFRAEHTPIENGLVRHALTGPVGVLREAQSIAAASNWSDGLADLAMRLPNGRNEIGSVGAVAATHLELPPHANALYSWVIAPARRA